MSSDEEPTKPEKGRVIAHKYLLVRELGEGGMGSVWVAKHLTLDIHQAIKFIRSGRAHASRERFHKEAALLARLHGSDHVVQIRDYGDDDGLPYIVMDLLDGETLHDRLKTWSSLTIKETNHILQQIVAGLALAHGQKIIHRDLKPANIFLARSRLNEREVVKILDFGIAKLIESDSAAARATRGIGSVVYMSPEHFLSYESFDPRSDLWSLGIVLFELLTGRLPYPFPEAFRVLAQLARGKGPTLRATDVAPHLPPEINRFFEIAFALEKKDRFQSAVEMGGFFGRIANAAREPSMSDMELTHPRFRRHFDLPALPVHPQVIDLPDDPSDTSTTSPFIKALPEASADVSPLAVDTLELVFGRPPYRQSTLPFIIVPDEPAAGPPDEVSDTDTTRPRKQADFLRGAVAPTPTSASQEGLAKPQANPSMTAGSGADRTQPLLTGGGTIVLPLVFGARRPLHLGAMPSNAGPEHMTAAGTMRLDHPSGRGSSPSPTGPDPRSGPTVASTWSGWLVAHRHWIVAIVILAVMGILVMSFLSRKDSGTDPKRESPPTSP